MVSPVKVADVGAVLVPAVQTVQTSRDLPSGEGQRSRSVRTAQELGLYAVPLTTSLTEVAESVGCSQSTASVILRRAERELIGGVFERFGGTGGT